MFEQTISATAHSELRRVEKLIAQRDDALAIPRISAEFLHTFVLTGGYRRGLELGTSYGYSGLWIGTALAQNGGVLTTIDHNAAKVESARETFRRAGLAAVVSSVEGEVAAVVPGLDGPFDFVFVDADKENCRQYYDLLWPKLAHRATIVTDNVTSHAEQMADYVTFLRNHPRLCSMLLPIGSGLEITVKLEPYLSTATVDGADWVI